MRELKWGVDNSEAKQEPASFTLVQFPHFRQLWTKKSIQIHHCVCGIIFGCALTAGYSMLNFEALHRALYFILQLPSFFFPNFLGRRDEHFFLVVAITKSTSTLFFYEVRQVVQYVPRYPSHPMEQQLMFSCLV